MTPTQVLLRDKASQQSRPFEADHAKRLLAYPNTQWQEIEPEATGDGSGTADTTAKTGQAARPARKKRAAAGKKTPAAAANTLPEVDTTGQPTSI